jgi:hypothetical protein
VWVLRRCNALHFAPRSNSRAVLKKFQYFLRSKLLGTPYDIRIILVLDIVYGGAN